jgi:hypothetical protein
MSTVCCYSAEIASTGVFLLMLATYGLRRWTIERMGE